MRGYQLMTNEEIFRGGTLMALTSPVPTRWCLREYKFSLHDVDHVFKAGHRVVVEIQARGSRSTIAIRRRSFQHHDGEPEDYKPATISVYSDTEHDSNLQIPLMNACDVIECFLSRQSTASSSVRCFPVRRTRLYGPLLRLQVHCHQSEFRLEARLPLEVIQQRPRHVPAHIHAVIMARFTPATAR